nr:protein FAR1-RELATED SEQUENCE 9-like [Aegilops tauschii subsp. strangulata]
MEDAFHQPANTHATNNAKSVSEMAIVPAIPTSTHVHTSTSNTQAGKTAADTEVNDETDDEAQGDEDGGQSEIMVPQPPYLGQSFDSFADAKEFYQTYAKFHGWHIIKKAEETLGPFFADRPELHKAFELCVDHSLTVEEFERSWMDMIETYQVQDQETLASLWEKRMYWVPAYFMQCFFPFLQTTQRSEGFNAVLKRWHIIKKAEETLGPFFADRPDLHKAFELCVDHSLTVEEFERSWMAMIETYQVQDHETLASLWEKRMYWVPAYFMQCFFPFLQTTQRSEGFNAVLKRYVSPGNSLLQFAKQYTALQQKILGSELQQEANTALKQPKLLTYLPMERQMSKIYTNTIFNKFQEERKRASMYTAFQVDEHTFKVCSIMGMSDSEPEDPDKGRNYFVKASISEGEYYCQCCKFERDGIVCCHILKVMDLNAVTRMPRHFIRQRWTWDADDALAPQTSNAVLAVHDERPESTMEAVRHVVLTKNYAELIDEACKSDETARVAEKHMKILKRELDEIKKRKAEEALHRFPRTSSVPSSTGPSSENSEVGSEIESTQTQVRNPPRSITKGRPKEIRYKSGLEIQAKHKKPKKGMGNPCIRIRSKNAMKE